MCMLRALYKNILTMSLQTHLLDWRLMCLGKELFKYIYIYIYTYISFTYIVSIYINKELTHILVFTVRPLTFRPRVKNLLCLRVAGTKRAVQLEVIGVIEERPSETKEDTLKNTHTRIQRQHTRSQSRVERYI